MTEKIITVTARNGLSVRVDTSDEIFKKFNIDFKYGERFDSTWGTGEIVGIGNGTNFYDIEYNVLWVYLKRDKTFFNRKRASYFSFGQICFLKKIKEA